MSDPLPFADAAAFAAWLAADHARERQVMVRMHKVGSGIPGGSWEAAVVEGTAPGAGARRTARRPSG